MKWYSIALVAVISGYLGFNFGSIVQRVNVYDQLGADAKLALSEYNKLHSIDKTNLPFVVTDSITRKESWWLGYRSSINTQRKRLEL